jgi:hypothetical protein
MSPLREKIPVLVLLGLAFAGLPAYLAVMEWEALRQSQLLSYCGQLLGFDWGSGPPSAPAGPAGTSGS